MPTLLRRSRSACKSCKSGLHQQSPEQAPAAFTLLELLCTLAIIAILIAILLPVTARAREAARASSCLAHERQIAIGVLTYTQDWDERFPQIHPTPETGPIFDTLPADASLEITGSWRERLSSYIPTPELFGCPSDIGFEQSHPSSYAPNGHLDFGAGLGDVATPSKTVLTAEIVAGSLAGELSPWLGRDILLGDIAADRHNGLAQYVFVDGHARSLPFDQTWMPINGYTLAP